MKNIDNFFNLITTKLEAIKKFNPDDEISNPKAKISVNEGLKLPDKEEWINNLQLLITLKKEDKTQFKNYKPIMTKILTLWTEKLADIHFDYGFKNYYFGLMTIAALIGPAQLRTFSASNIKPLQNIKDEDAVGYLSKNLQYSTALVNIGFDDETALDEAAQQLQKYQRKKEVDRQLQKNKTLSIDVITERNRQKKLRKIDVQLKDED